MKNPPNLPEDQSPSKTAFSFLCHNFERKCSTFFSLKEERNDLPSSNKQRLVRCFFLLCVRFIWAVSHSKSNFNGCVLPRKRLAAVLITFRYQIFLLILLIVLIFYVFIKYVLGSSFCDLGLNDSLKYICKHI